MPTPEPSSDGVDPASAATGRRCGTGNKVDPPAPNLRKRERSSSSEELLVSKEPEAKRLKLNAETRRAPEQRDQNARLTEAIPAGTARVGTLPRHETLPPSSPVRTTRPRFRDSSVQTSPPAEEAQRVAPASASSPTGVERTSPRPRTRSLALVRPLAPLLSTHECHTASTATYVGPVLPLSRVDRGQIFSRLQQAAAEQQQRLESERRPSVSGWDLPSVRSAVGPVTGASAAAVESSLATQPDTESVANEPQWNVESRDDEVPKADRDAPVSRTRTLKPTSSSILMPPPPPAITASRASPAKREDKPVDASSRTGAPGVLASGELRPPRTGVAAAAVPSSSSESSSAAAVTASQDRSTQSSDSVVRDSQEGSSTQSSKSDASFPSAAQVQRERSTSVTYPQPGFTATTAATEEAYNVSLLPPAAAQEGGGDPTPDLTSKSDLHSLEAGGPFLLEPWSGHVDSSLHDFLTGSSARSTSIDEVSTSEAPARPAPNTESRLEPAFTRALSSSQSRQGKREISEPPLEYSIEPTQSNQPRASSFPLAASQNVPAITFDGERRRPPPRSPRVVVASESLETDETESFEEGDDLYSSMPMTPEELEQQFAEMEEARRPASVATRETVPSQVKPVVAASLNGASVSREAVGSSGDQASQADEATGVEGATPRREHLSRGLVEERAADGRGEEEDLHVEVRCLEEQREEVQTVQEQTATAPFSLKLQEVYRLRIAEEVASNEGDLLDDDDDLDIYRVSSPREQVSRPGAALVDEPFSQALLTQAGTYEESQQEQHPSQNGGVSDRDGPIPARRRSFTNLEDEAELSEHEQDELNKGLEEDMWAYLEIMKRED